jgi:hypothetical protein
VKNGGTPAKKSAARYLKSTVAAAHETVMSRRVQLPNAYLEAIIRPFTFWQ